MRHVLLSRAQGFPIILWIALALALLHPILHLLSLYVAWGIHWTILGHNPRWHWPGDAKTYGDFWLRLSGEVPGLLLITLPLSFVVGGTLTSWFSISRSMSWRGLVGGCFVFVMPWAVWYLVLKADPGGIFEWWWD